MPQEIRRLQFLPDGGLLCELTVASSGYITATHCTRKSENRRALVGGGIESRF